MRRKLLAAPLLALALAACGIASAHVGRGRVLAVGAENEYANVISQIGGRYVNALAIESNPNADPHSFEASPSIAREVAQARLVVQNGVGYDDWISHIEAATTGSERKVIVAARLLHLPPSTANPHLWYMPRTMPLVAGAVARALSALQPAHAAYFAARARAFDASLDPWRRALAAFAREHPGLTAAVTEPVGDYMLQAAGARILTPFAFQADVMNGVDPAPQLVSLESSLLLGRRVRVFVYNQQVTDTLTQGFLADAARAHVPVVGVYETMPPGYDYQSWMIAELRALARAVQNGVSTERLR
jgi:zinc/manganese transport system substrate-binding protein